MRILVLNMERKEVGTIIVKKAGKILLDYFKKENVVKNKGETDFVLDADFEAEKIILKTLQKEFPNDSILSEESDEVKGDSEYRWIVDPLDGTINFKARIPYFCVSIGLEKENKLIMAFVYNPITDEFYFAEKNRGAFLNGDRIKTSSTEQLTNFLISYSTSNHKTPEVRELGVNSFRKMLNNCRAIRLRGSSILDLCNLANGVFDGLIKVGASYWDFAPGCLIVEEAGGKVTDFQGNDWGLETQNLIASNKIQHHQLLKILNSQ